MLIYINIIKIVYGHLIRTTSTFKCVYGRWKLIHVWQSINLKMLVFKHHLTPEREHHLPEQAHG